MIMNVAVGGTNTYFEDGVGGKPWVNSDQHSVNKFWDAKDQWLPTWDGEDAAMKVAMTLLALCGTLNCLHRWTTSASIRRRSTSR